MARNMKLTKTLSSAALITMVLGMIPMGSYGIALAEPITDLTPVVQEQQVEKVPVRQDLVTPAAATTASPITAEASPSLTIGAPSVAAPPTSSALDVKSLNNALFLLQIQQELKSAYNDYHKLNTVIDGSQEQVNGLKDKLGSLRDEILNFQKQIDVSEARIKNVSTQIGLQSKEIGLLEEEIMARGIALEEQKSLLADYMRMMYVNENRFRGDNGDVSLSPAKLLLSDTNLGETVQQMATLDMLQHSGQNMLWKLRSSQETIAQIQSDVGVKKKTLDALQDKLLTQRDRLEDEKITKEKLLQVTHGEDQTYKKLIAESLAQQDDSLLQINALQSNFNYVKDNLSKLGNSVGVTDIQRLLDERTRQIYDFQQQTDQDSILQWPVNPSRGISAFFHDSSYRSRFGVGHEAIDIPTMQGTAIHAPKDGIVYKVKDNGMGYSYIILSHKGQIMTVYGHVSSILVKEGQAVMAGTVIGLTGGMLGTKGAGYMTTGAHLHLEVLYKGSHVDPLDYLSLSKLSLDDLPAKYAKRVENEGIRKAGAGVLLPGGSSLLDGSSGSSAGTGLSSGSNSINGLNPADMTDPAIEETVRKSVEERGQAEIDTYKKIFGE